MHSPEIISFFGGVGGVQRQLMINPILQYGLQDCLLMKILHRVCTICIRNSFLRTSSVELTLIFSTFYPVPCLSKFPSASH